MSGADAIGVPFGELSSLQFALVIVASTCNLRDVSGSSIEASTVGLPNSTTASTLSLVCRMTGLRTPVTGVVSPVMLLRSRLPCIATFAPTACTDRKSVV